MAVNDYLYRATRDVVGGAFGGLLSAWTLTDMNQTAIIITGVGIIFALGAMYYMFDRVRSTEESIRSKPEESDSPPEGHQANSDVLSGKPRVAGRRIGVHFIAERVESGLDPETIADRHDLVLADVYRALAYYHEHPDEMAEIDAERERKQAEARDDPEVATGPADAPLDPE